MKYHEPITVTMRIDSPGFDFGMAKTCLQMQSGNRINPFQGKFIADLIMRTSLDEWQKEYSGGPDYIASRDLNDRKHYVKILAKLREKYTHELL